MNRSRNRAVDHTLLAERVAVSLTFLLIQNGVAHIHVSKLLHRKQGLIGAGRDAGQVTAHHARVAQGVNIGRVENEEPHFLGRTQDGIFWAGVDAFIAMGTSLQKLPLRNRARRPQQGNPFGDLVHNFVDAVYFTCLLYTSDAADE